MTVGLARDLRKRLTPQEAKLWLALRELRRDQGLHFRRQAPLLGYVLDFACFDRRLAIEVDGGQHTLADQVAYDGRRDAVLARAGVLTLRVQNHKVDGGCGAVVDAVVQVALERPSTRQAAVRP